MQAVLSGRAGVAVLKDGDAWNSIDYEQMDRLVPRQPEELEILFRGAGDLEWIDVASIDELRDRLADAVDSTEALNLLRYLCDDRLSEDTLQSAAQELEELIVYPEIVASLEQVLFASPLPKSTNLEPGSKACRNTGCHETAKFLERLVKLQPTFVKVALKRLAGIDRPQANSVDHSRSKSSNVTIRAEAKNKVVLQDPPRIEQTPSRWKPLPGLPAPGGSKGGVRLDAGGGSKGGDGTRAIFGNDDRILISPSDDPFRHICYLEYVAADGSRMRGSGWLVGPTTVITAGHCVFDREHGNDFVRSMQVFPARNGNSIPAVATAVDFQTVAEWANRGDTAYDYGAVILDRPLGDDFGCFSYAQFPDADLQDMIVNVVGYPREVNPPLMYGQSNRLSDVRDHKLVYTIDTTPGLSGCPVICFDGDDTFTVVGIHDGNFVTRITADVFANINKWKNLSASMRPHIA